MDLWPGAPFDLLGERRPPRSLGVCRSFSWCGTRSRSDELAPWLATRLVFTWTHLRASAPRLRLGTVLVEFFVDQGIRMFTDDEIARAARAKKGSPFLSTEQAAFYLGLSPRKLQAMRGAGT